MKRIILSLLVPILFLAKSIQAQKLDSAVVVQAIESKNYIFKAQTVTPQRGGLRHLTPEYDFVVKPDTLNIDLPYFGRAYSAPINPSDAGIKFTSMKYEYAAKRNKKNRWEITIKPNDVNWVRDLYLTVFDNGRASLRVNSNDRESISYDGYLKTNK